MHKDIIYYNQNMKDRWTLKDGTNVLQRLEEITDILPSSMYRSATLALIRAMKDE